jgi:hypothetical protein
VVVAVATGGGIARALVFAFLAFVLATGWSWLTWRRREREERIRKAESGK